MTEAEERQRIAEARARLWVSLSNGKYTGDPHTDTIEEIRPLSDALRLNAARAQLRQTLDRSHRLPIKYDGCPDCQTHARRELIKTMSGKAPVEETPTTESTIQYRTSESGAIIASEVQPAAIAKLATARADLVKTLSTGKKSMYRDVANANADMSPKHNAAEPTTMDKLNAAATLAQAKDALVRTMQCGGRGRGIRSAVEDSGGTNTPSGTPFSGGFPISVRSVGGKGISELIDNESEPVDTAVPAVVSDQTTVQSDWSPDTAANGDYVSDQPFDADKAKSNLLAHYRNKNDEISGYAKRWFLNTLSYASQPDHFQIPLGQISASQQPYYDSAALLEAWKHATGTYNAAANRSLQLRFVRIMRRSGFVLTPDMQEFANKYMGESKPDDDENNQEVDNHNE